MGGKIPGGGTPPKKAVPFDQYINSTRKSRSSLTPCEASNANHKRENEWYPMVLRSCRDSSGACETRVLRNSGRDKLSAVKGAY